MPIELRQSVITTAVVPRFERSGSKSAGAVAFVISSIVIYFLEY